MLLGLARPISRYRASGPAALLASLLTLTGCATQPELLPLEAADGDSWALRQGALQEIRNWSLGGRVAVSAEGEGWYAGLDWRQAGSSYHLELRGPLGHGRLWIDGDEQGVTAVAGDGTVHEGATAEQLLANAYGWRLPLSGLRYWVRGLPDPALAVDEISFDSLGRLGRLRQAGWRISYPNYQDLPGIDLPRTITVEGHGLSLKLVVDRWQLV